MPNKINTRERAENVEWQTEKKRIEALAITWITVVSNIAVKDKGLFELNPSIAVKVVTHYAADLGILKNRYRIPDRAQAPKVAGLMTSAILKYRPIVPKDCMQLGIEENEINEIFAVYHGICICAGYNSVGIGNHAMAKLMAKPYFRNWLKRIIFLLKERNYTSESLIAIFETLCMAVFPNGMFDVSQDVGRGTDTEKHKK